MIMTHDEIAQMVSDYKTALEHKITSETLVQDLTIRAETLQSRVLRVAYDNKMIVGKNADIRKHEERVHLADSASYQDLLIELIDAQAAASAANIEFKAQELLTSLTRAWLYAQRQELP